MQCYLNIVLSIAPTDILVNTFWYIKKVCLKNVECALLPFRSGNSAHQGSDSNFKSVFKQNNNHVSTGLIHKLYKLYTTIPYICDTVPSLYVVDLNIVLHVLDTWCEAWGKLFWLPGFVLKLPVYILLRNSIHDIHLLENAAVATYSLKRWNSTTSPVARDRRTRPCGHLG
jgi:hypothetical protein